MNDMTKSSQYCEVNDLDAFREELLKIRHHIHQHPELAYEEHDTAALVAEKLRGWGYEVTTGVGKTGVVGTLTAGTGTRRIGIRADMDALPIREKTGLSYASKHDGKMHACGHDGHTTMLLGTAWYLAKHRNFSGTVHLYFQPAEEIGLNSGAAAMIADGLFERFPCDAVFGLHNHPGAPTGTMLFRSGVMMSASDKAFITVRGKGGHGARPHLTVDPIVVTASIVMALQTVVSRNLDPAQSAVVTVGVMQSGSATNIIPDSARLDLGIRSFDPDTRKLLQERITSLVQLQAESYGATAEVDYVLGYPNVINSDPETQLAIQVARELLGDSKVEPNMDILMGSEDFAYMLEQRPGCFLRLGNDGKDEDICMVHNPAYDFNDNNLTIGAAYWARLAQRFLEREETSL